MSYRVLSGSLTLPALRGRGGVSLTAKTGAACGWLYVAGRQAAELDRYALAEDTFSFGVKPDTVDPFWSVYGAVSHIVLWYRGQYWIYGVQSGHVADGRVTIVWPSWLRMDTHPGPRLPML